MFTILATNFPYFSLIFTLACYLSLSVSLLPGFRHSNPISQHLKLNFNFCAIVAQCSHVHSFSMLPASSCMHFVDPMCIHWSISVSGMACFAWIQMHWLMQYNRYSSAQEEPKGKQNDLWNVINFHPKIISSQVLQQSGVDLTFKKSSGT